MIRIKDNLKDLINVEKRIFGLDLIRFTAIFYVFWGHGIIIIPHELRDAYYSILFLPVEGVSIFFVLSGFLIGNILIRTAEKTTFNFNELRNFWARRWYRTLPNYFIVIGILLLFNAKSENFDWRFLIFTQSLIGKHPDFFTPAWSLAVEEWFYTFFPLVLLLIISVTKKFKTSLILCISLFMVTPLILRLCHFLNPDFLPSANPIRKTTIFRFDSMMFGIIAAYIHSKHNKFWKEKVRLFNILGIASLLIIISLRFGSSLFEIPIFDEVFVYYFESIPVFLFLPYFSSIKTIKHKKIEKSIVFISKTSYSIYLVHGSLVLWFMLRNLQANEMFQSIRFELQSLILFGLYVFLTFLFSVMLYIFIEKPVMNFRDRITKHY